MNRAEYNSVFTKISIAAGVVSLLLGMANYFKWCSPMPAWVGPVLIGLWALGPPIFFWVDWVAFAGEINDDPKREIAKHTHDLGRNIWIAFVAILAYLFGVHFTGG